MSGRPGDAARSAQSTVMAAEMAEQPDVLRRMIERLPSIVESVREVAPRPLAGIAMLARGSSDNAAVLGRYLIETVSGRPAGLAAPSLTTRYRAPVDYSGYLVVALSQSGGTPEIVSTAASMRERGGRIVAVTNEATSDLARIGDVVVHTAAGPERAVPATKTVTAQMLALVAVAAALGKLPFDAAELGALPDAVETVLDHPAACADLARAWSGHDRLVVAGRGMGYAAALEGALKIRETAGVFAEGTSVADLLHGPIAALDARLPVVLVDVGIPTTRDLAQLRARLVAEGIPDAVLTAVPPEAAPDLELSMAAGTPPAATLRIPDGLPEPAAVIAATVLLQQLALAFAVERGRNPDSPAGLTKLTPTR